ncbi:MAG: PilC/PilY family type IV pilus protein, partial [Rhodoferax sp.]
INGGQGNSCSGKTVGTLSQVSGVCPDAPAMMGTYKVAGAALYANTSNIRTLASEPPDLKYVQDALKVKTLAASLSGGAARIDVLIPGSNPKKYVYITPESLWNSDIGSALTFVSLSSSATHGAFIVTWNDALMGGDHDMDLTGFLRYDLVEDTSTTPSTWDILVTTDVPNNCSGKGGTHGFSIIGVTKAKNGSQVSANSRYLTHQHWSPQNNGDSVSISSVANKEGYYLCGNQAGDYSNYTALKNDSSTSHLTIKNWKYSSNSDLTGSIDNTTTNAAGACRIHQDNYCKVQNKDFQIQLRFKMSGAEDAVLKDPLWYAAKYGSFASSSKKADGTFNNIPLPPDQASWDKFKSDGTPVADGTPDGYYLARRPELLEQQLRRALDNLAKNSNAAPAVSSSQLITDGFKYIAKFDSTTVDGNIEAYKVDSLGYFDATPEWRAGQILRIRTSGPTGDNGNSRSIITNNGNASSAAAATSGGFAFRWAGLPTDFKTQMTTASTNKLTPTNASLVVDYMRGDQSREAVSTGLRARGDNILGPIVNATPWIQDRPIANYTEGAFPGYQSFVKEHTYTNKRDKLLWVGSNDGMLHAFNPTTGDEIFAYVPGVLANRLAEIPLQRGTPGRTRLDNANFTLDTISETLPEGTVWPYVDGSPFTADVMVGTDWKTYAFSTLGRGGKGLFALDVTNVTLLSSAESNAQSIFKWQFTSDDDPDLGYVVNDVGTSISSGQAAPIVKLNNGKFALLLGNGQKSTSGKAVLFMLFMDGPDAASGNWTGKYIKIEVDAGSGNGLSTPTWVDLDNSGTADMVYAGDLKGNLWKFDVSSTSASNWAVAYSNKPLFTAKDGSATLAITTAPEITYPPFDGLIINFATGNSFQSGDFPQTTVTQKVFGIWDRPDFASLTGRSLPTDLTTLVPRTYARQT